MDHLVKYFVLFFESQCYDPVVLHHPLRRLMLVAVGVNVIIACKSTCSVEVWTISVIQYRHCTLCCDALSYEYLKLDLYNNFHAAKLSYYYYPPGGNDTSAGWQVTLCDPIWHVSSRSIEACFILLYIGDVVSSHIYASWFSAPSCG